MAQRRPLLSPRGDRNDLPELALSARGRAAVICEGQNQFLIPRREQREVHDLGDPRTRQPRPPGDLRVIPHCAVSDEALEVVAEDETQSQRRDAWNGHLRRGRVARALGW